MQDMPHVVGIDGFLGFVYVMIAVIGFWYGVCQGFRSMKEPLYITLTEEELAETEFSDEEELNDAWEEVEDDIAMVPDSCLSVLVGVASLFVTFVTMRAHATDDRLTREQIERFHQEGYHLSPGLLSAEESAELRAELLGILQAVRQYSLLDSVASIVGLFFYSMPSFWLALMMVLVFSLFAYELQWPIQFPGTDIQSVDYTFLGPLEKVQDRLMHLTLPATSLALVLAAGIARYTRGSMLEVIRQDFVRTARAKGLSEPVVIFKHALRNGLIPVITLLGLYLPFLFSGTVFIESVFSWPGMGKLVVDAITERDYPVIMGGSLVFANMVVVGNLVSDVLYAVVDPRIRYD
mgnify:CR=1 FL=1